MGPSPAKLVDATPPEAAAEIPSTWRAAIRSATRRRPRIRCRGATSGAIRGFENRHRLAPVLLVAPVSRVPRPDPKRRIQSYARSDSECQTEGWLAGATATDAADVLNDLPGFLRRAVPAMVAALEENERSATFGWDLSSAADATGLDDPAACSIAPMHSLSPHHPDAFVGRERRDGGRRDGGFPWADLRPTGVSWNASGVLPRGVVRPVRRHRLVRLPRGALRVEPATRGRGPGATARRDGDVVVSAVRGVSSAKPNVVAAGSLDGEVMVWDLAVDADAAGVPAKGVPAGGADGVTRSDGGKGSGGNGGGGDALVVRARSATRRTGSRSRASGGCETPSSTAVRPPGLGAGTTTARTSS